jgi:spore germination cell wall hydrolase CwlJ-like protein
MRRAFWLATCVSVLSAGLLSIRPAAAPMRERREASHSRLRLHGGFRLRPLLLIFRLPTRRPARVSVTRPLRARVDLLARLIQAEAGDQSYATQVAVGAVVLHRLRSPRFPHHLAAVITESRQFSVVAAGTFTHAHPTRRALNAARAALAGTDPTPGALYFYSPTLPHVPWMNTLGGCRTIGALRFCAGPR